MGVEYIVKFSFGTWACIMELLHKFVVFGNVLRSLFKCVLMHAVIIHDCDAEMFCRIHPWKNLVIQHHFSQNPFFFKKRHAFRFTFGRILMCAERQIVTLGIVATRV